MILTNKQQKGLDIALSRYKQGEKCTVISGYAGTGKSTLVKFIIEALQVNPNSVIYTSFTGKATQVLQKKGNKNTSTLHKLLFESIPKKTGGFFRRVKSNISPYEIVIVDEVSMAPKSLMDILFKHNVHVICLGDPFQLPPIDKKEDNKLLETPHIFLDEIMRQAAESEIIRLSMDIRERKSIKPMSGSEVMIFNKNKLNTGMLQWADQILVGTNATRKNINTQMRDLLGRGAAPEDGDKVICLRNYADICSINGDTLVNGTIGYLDGVIDTNIYLPKWINSSIDKFDITNARFISDSNSDFGSLEMDKNMILTGEKCCDWKIAYQLSQLKGKIGDIVPLEFTYGYAITGHKSQGSEWDNVLTIEEKFPFVKEEHARWLYTCCTRASKKLVLVKSE